MKVSRSCTEWEIASSSGKCWVTLTWAVTLRRCRVVWQSLQQGAALVGQVGDARALHLMCKCVGSGLLSQGSKAGSEFHDVFYIIFPGAPSVSLSCCQTPVSSKSWCLLFSPLVPHFICSSLLLCGDASRADQIKNITEKDLFISVTSFVASLQRQTCLSLDVYASVLCSETDLERTEL